MRTFFDWRVLGITSLFCWSFAVPLICARDGSLKCLMIYSSQNITRQSKQSRTYSSIV